MFQLECVRLSCLPRWDIYALVMMDDSVIIHNPISKIQIMHEFCRSHDMVVNNSKTKVMVVNGMTKIRKKYYSVWK